MVLDPEIGIADDEACNFRKFVSIRRLNRVMWLNLKNIGRRVTRFVAHSQTIAISFRPIPPTIKNAEKIW